MSLAEELLEEALRLISSESPTQAALRRSISTSYYALFHFLIDEAAKLFIGGSGREKLRSAVRRTFAHSRMADACNAFLRDRHKLSDLLTQAKHSESDLGEVCRAFLLLQDSRHRADYDTSVEYTYNDAFGIFVTAEVAFQDWKLVRDTEDAQVFLVALLLWKDLRD